MHYYESHKSHIFYKINSIQSTIFEKLLPVYDDIETESKIIEKEKLDELSKIFNPDIMDPSDAYQVAWEDGAEYYTLQHAMKTEFLLSTATWLFHLFEKDCREMCPNLYTKPDKLQKKIEDMGINCDDQSNWYKINTELRLVANTIKHGEGPSCKKLKEIRPSYFETKISYLTHNKIEITHQDICTYIEQMKSFWNSFFDKILPKEKE